MVNSEHESQELYAGLSTCSYYSLQKFLSLCLATILTSQWILAVVLVKIVHISASTCTLDYKYLCKLNSIINIKIFHENARKIMFKNTRYIEEKLIQYIDTRKYIYDYTIQRNFIRIKTLIRTFNTIKPLL